MPKALESEARVERDRTAKEMGIDGFQSKRWQNRKLPFRR